MEVSGLFTNLVATASVMELIWLLNATVGLTLSSRNFKDALTDYRALGKIQNGRRTIAVNSLILEGIISSKFLLYIIAGLFAITADSVGPPSVVGMLVTTILVIGSILLTVISWSNRRTSQYLLAHGLQNRDKAGKFIKSTDASGDDITD